MKARGRRRITHLRRVQLLAFLCGLPGLIGCLLFLWTGNHPLHVWFTVFILIGGAWLLISARLQNVVVQPLQSATNMLSALREGDFSLHASYVHQLDPLGQLMLEINRLTEVLSEHRLEAMEANNLLDKIVEEIDAAVITFDPRTRLTLANRAALRMLRVDRASALKKDAADLGLDKVLECDSDSIIPHPNPQRDGRFLLRKGSYRVDGVAHTLIILIDVSKKLREEELQAWKRILRVLGHELNNSMAPIHSLSESLQKTATRDPLDAEDREDLVTGLDIIRQRSDSLNRFVKEFTRLAKLPVPQTRPTPLLPLVSRIASLFSDPVPEVDLCAEMTIPADPDLLEQALLNLIKNAVEAARETRGRVRICWKRTGDLLHIHVEDTGPGIANPDNLFVPFFSTKKEGSGIGLTLARQIAEGHDGSLQLANREDTTGCRATLCLPMR